MTKADTTPRDSSRDSAQERAMLKRIEADLVIEQLKASKSASEKAAEHFGIYGGGYLCFMVTIFFASVLFLPSEAVAVCCGLTTLIVSSMTALLREVVSDESRPDSSNGNDK